MQTIEQNSMIDGAVEFTFGDRSHDPYCLGKYGKRMGHESNRQKIEKAPILPRVRSNERTWATKKKGSGHRQKTSHKPKGPSSVTHLGQGKKEAAIDGKTSHTPGSLPSVTRLGQGKQGAAINGSTASDPV